MASFRTNPDGTRTVTLTAPITVHGGTTSEITLRAPRYKEFMQFGDPTVLVLAGDALVPQEDLAVIRNYIGALADVNEALIDAQVDLVGAMGLRDAVKDFFKAASAKTSTRSPTSSSSAPDGQSAASKS